MAQPTYTLTGVLKDDTLEVSAYLPQLTGDNYIFSDIYNISKTHGQSQINALLIHLSTVNGNNTELQHGSGDPMVPLPLVDSSSSITDHSLAPQFDWSADEVLVILYHEPANAKDIDSMQEKVLQIFDTILQNGSFNTTWVRKEKNSAAPIEKSGIVELIERIDIPKKAGMTIITRS